MSIDDKLEKTIESLSEEGTFNGVEENLLLLVSMIPIAGGSINSLLSGVAKRRVVDRATEVFGAVKERLEEVEESKIDRAFFETEEFQTLLTLVLEQLQTTHDKAKLQSLAAALVNGGLKEFSADTRKELFLRILRDLSPNQLHLLDSLRPSPQFESYLSDWPVRSNPKGEELAVLQSLAANGLVDQTLERARPPSLRADIQSIERLNSYLAKAPAIVFRLNSFGMDFLKFIGRPDIPRSV
jgi:hypothetical protein